MDCGNCQDKLSLYIDGQLTEAERLRVEEEIASCADCAREYESLKELISELNEIGPLEVPSTLMADLKAAFRAELAVEAAAEPRPKSFYDHFGPWRTAAAILLGLLTFLVVADDQGLFSKAERVAEERASAARKTQLSTDDGDDGFGEAAPSEAKDLSEKKDFDGFAKSAPAGDEEEAEERLIGSWGSFVDRLRDKAESRGMNVVASRRETEGFLAGTDSKLAPGAALERPDPENDDEDLSDSDDPRRAPPSSPRKSELKKEVGEKSRKGEPALEVDAEEAKEADKATSSPPPTSSFIVLGEDPVTKIARMAEKRGLEAVFSPIKGLEKDPGKVPESAALEVEIRLGIEAGEAFLKELKTKPGLTIRLFAESKQSSENKDAPAPRERILHLILPRP